MVRAREKKSDSERSIQDRSWDVLAEMWLDREGDELLERLENDKAAGNTLEMDAFFAKYDAKNLRLIQKSAQRHRRRHFLKTTLPRFARAAAIGITVLLVAGGVAVASNSTVRIYLMKLLVESTPKSTCLRIEKDRRHYIDIPSEWQGEYYPTILPKNLVIEDIYSLGTNENRVTYSSPDSGIWQLKFAESTDGTMEIDTEDAEISEVMVCGLEGSMISKENSICIYWFDGTRLFVMDVRGFSEREALRFANSVRRIR